MLLFFVGIFFGRGGVGIGLGFGIGLATLCSLPRRTARPFPCARRGALTKEYSNGEAVAGHLMNINIFCPATPFLSEQSRVLIDNNIGRQILCRFFC